MKKEIANILLDEIRKELKTISPYWSPTLEIIHEKLSKLENELKKITDKAIKCQQELNDFWEDIIVEVHQNECPEIGFDENATTHDKCKGSKETHPPLKSLINKFFEAN